MNFIELMKHFKVKINLDLHELLEAPVNLYIMNVDNVCIAANQHMIKDLKNFIDDNPLDKQLEEFVDDESTVRSVTANNNRVVQEQRMIVISEPIVNKHGKTRIYLSVKMPLYDDTKVCGVLGISIRNNFEEERGLARLLPKNYGMLFPQNQDAVLTAAIVLSFNEQKCLYYLAHHLTAKEMASCLQISPRTVEAHLNNLKKKLNCNSLSSLIYKAIELGIIKINFNLKFNC